MRLYAKLLVMILMAGSFQRYAPPSAWGGEAWFAVRCHAATLLGDHEMSMRLVDEYYHRHRTIDDEARDDIDVELSFLADVAADAEAETHVGCEAQETHEAGAVVVAAH